MKSGFARAFWEDVLVDFAYIAEETAALHAFGRWAAALRHVDKYANIMNIFEYSPPENEKFVLLYGIGSRILSFMS